MDFYLKAAVCILILTRHTVRSTHPDCSIVLHLLKEENECKVKIKNLEAAESLGCVMEWDGLSCWSPASEGEIVSVHCPELLLQPGTAPVVVSRRCSARGWREPEPPYHLACFSEEEEEQEQEEEEEMSREKQYFDTLRWIYSVGYGASLAALFIAVLLFCFFRKLLCTRNCIHLHLFVTFMLRSLAVFIKDAVLFADRSTDHCTVSTLWCKAAVTFFHFCVTSNFSWLLVEGLYLQTLLIFTFTETRKLFRIYAAIGWGSPTATIVIWALLKEKLDNEGCWDDLDSSLWWIIKIPILLSIFINFLIFVNISRIIVQKTKATNVNQSQTQLWRRLLHSTLLLIPLFGVHYVVFALFPEHVGVGPRLYLELVLGSFQGLIVAVLYCFLNGEVQNEIQSWMRSCRPETNTNVVNLPTQEDVP
ncbi:growth hormone releasing hormone receptor 2 [Limanda limanda]|uniref:growth hormone releasing hormone receptor 2 n=1 Tax=Limanda limanda TaxID=27771 RepID=UPI0029C65C59|nr:growth hormone releasing hormone receptor 2 [Limanda limanda]